MVDREILVYLKKKKNNQRKSISHNISNLQVSIHQHQKKPRKKHKALCTCLPYLPFYFCSVKSYRNVLLVLLLSGFRLTQRSSAVPWTLSFFHPEMLKLSRLVQWWQIFHFRTKFLHLPSFSFFMSTTSLTLCFVKLTGFCSNWGP